MSGDQPSRGLLMALELISFDLCPFVQRSVITLLEKDADFKVTYIDLAKPPAWFLEISPFGKVPVLKAENEIIFESAVINEYVDEVTPPCLMPEKPITKAINRAWIEFASELLSLQYKLSVAQNQQEYDETESRLLINIDKLESQLKNTIFFNGNDISLVDTAFAPLFLRFELLFKYLDCDIFEDKVKTQKWSDKLLSRSSVINSVGKDFEDKFIEYIRDTSQFMQKKMDI